MPIIVKEPESSFTPCPPGAHHAVCVDVVDLGQVETQWGMKPMVRIVWQVEETMPDGRPFLASQRFGASLHEKSTLRKFLESWRGKPLTGDDLRGLDLEKLIGVNALLNIVQTSKDGRIYSNIAAIMPPPKSAPKLTVRDYTRKKDRDTSDPHAAPVGRNPGEDDDDDPFPIG